MPAAVSARDITLLLCSVGTCMAGPVDVLANWTITVPGLNVTGVDDFELTITSDVQMTLVKYQVLNERRFLPQ